MNQIRVLHVVSELNQGGIENFIMNVYRNIDKTKVQFDFIVHHREIGTFEKEIEQLGGRIYHFPLFDDKNIIKYISNLKDFFKNHKEYNVIHGHLASVGFIYLTLAKKYGISCRIAHSHGTSTPKSFKGFIKSILFKFFKTSANVQFACSTEAGNFLFGKKSSFILIPNAIDFNRFKFDNKVRDKFRKQFGVENDFVIGHVGRFTIEKNHIFLLKILEELLKKNHNVKLMLVGDGKLKKDIYDIVEKNGLLNYVIFTGNRKDVENMYAMMDCFLLPSLFEGLPVTGIEAQVSGLPSIFSNNITREVNISNLASFLRIDDVSCWTNKIFKINTVDRNNLVITNDKFNIVNLVLYLENFYLKYYIKDSGNNEKINL